MFDAALSHSTLPRIFRSAARALRLRRPGVAAALAALVGCLPAVATAQQASLQGIVTSSATGSPLEGVAVVLEAGGETVHGTLTDRNGFYQIGGIGPGA